MRNHTEKLEEAITREAAQFFEREGNRSTLITVTRTQLTKRGNGAILFVSVFPPEKEASAIAFIERNLGELRTTLRKEIRSRAVPTLRVIPDHGEQTRDEINRLLREE